MSKHSDEKDATPSRLPNGLTPEQDAAFDALAAALAEHLYGVIPPGATDA